MGVIFLCDVIYESVMQCDVFVYLTFLYLDIIDEI